MKKFWNWKVKAATETAPEERTLFLNGTIAEDSWYGKLILPEAIKVLKQKAGTSSGS